jgi:hypothetical protein
MEDERRAIAKELLTKIAIGVIAALVVSITGYIVPKLTTAQLSTIEVVTTGLNLTVVTLFCLFSMSVARLDFFGPFIPNATDEKVRQRANRLMKQLNTNILMYAFCLIVVYAIYCAHASFGLNPEFVEQYTNLFNFGSSLFIYLAFKVLYDKTLDKDNEPVPYYMDAAIFALMGIIAYVLVTEPRLVGLDNIAIMKKNFSLLIGILNSLAMGLLFARFISMENALVNIFEADDKQEPNKNQKIILKNMMIFLLPLYAAVQPIFGNFNLEAGMGPPAIHRNVVFLICFVGKTFFLAIYSYYAHRRWIHLYLYSMIYRQGIPHSLKTKFKLTETYWDDSEPHAPERLPVDSKREANLPHTG